jgi:hypothetical protein
LNEILDVLWALEFIQISGAFSELLGTWLYLDVARCNE